MTKSCNSWQIRMLLAGGPGYLAAVEDCSKGIVEEFSWYAGEARTKLHDTKRGSKLWWTISRDLLQ